MKSIHPDDTIQFLAGGGEMGELTRTKDWSKTSLGPPSTWPESLHTTLSILLNSKFPMFLWWGPELTCFYNDAYRPSLGQNGKHPSILGMRAEEAWTETWDVIKPLIDQVLSGSEATWSEDQLIPIYRNGKIQDVYWTFSYSPICDEFGTPVGVFVTCVETTEKVLTHKKLEQSKEQLEFAIEAAQLGTIDYNPLTNKVSANNRLKKWFGLPANEQIELGHVLRAIAEKDRQRVALAIQKALEFSSGGNYDIEYTVVHPVSKEETIVHAKGIAWFNEQKTAYRFNGTLEDVTEQAKSHKKLAESEQRFQAAVAAVKGILWTNNAKGEMEGEQPGWSELTGQQYDEYQGFGWSNAVHSHDVQPTIEAWNEAVRERKMFLFEHRVKMKNGSWREFSVRAIPVMNDDGSIREWVGVHTDIADAKQAEKALKENQEKLSVVIDASELGMWEVDLKLEEVIYTKRLLEILGFKNGMNVTLDEMRKQIHPEEMELLEKAYKKAMETGVLDFTGRIIWRDGTIHWLQNKGKVFYDDKFEPSRIMGTSRDVTNETLQQQILSKNEQKFRLLADSMPQHIWTSDPEGNLNYYNQSVFDYSGLTLEHFNKDGWIQIVHPDDRAENIRQWIDSVTTGKDFLFEHRFRKHTGEYRWQLSRAIPQRDEHGKIQMWVGSSTDIHDKKEFTDELERKVLERTQQLNDKNTELEKMNKDLQSFAYISSHDLQEPLRKIQTFATRIVEKEYQNLSDGGKDYFKRMQGAAKRMQMLIDDLLSYSRTTTAERNYENIDLNKIVEEVKADLKEELEQKNATIQTNEMCEANVIPFQFRQLLHNLISNSLKFSSPERAPLIKIESKIENNLKFENDKLLPSEKYCHVRISDNGIGFEQQYSEKIFELFQRLHGKAEYVGTGIGLAIVKKNIENHNGIITANAELNKGAAFDIYIPVAT